MVVIVDCDCGLWIGLWIGGGVGGGVGGVGGSEVVFILSKLAGGWVCGWV